MPEWQGRGRVIGSRWTHCPFFPFFLSLPPLAMPFLTTQWVTFFFDKTFPPPKCFNPNIHQHLAKGLLFLWVPRGQCRGKKMWMLEHNVLSRISPQRIWAHSSEGRKEYIFKNEPIRSAQGVVQLYSSIFKGFFYRVIFVTGPPRKGSPSTENLI